MTSTLNVQIAISDTFWDGFMALRQQEQKRVRDFVTKFRSNPKSPGINYETIRNARDKDYRSVRVTQDIRGIVLRPDSGNTYILLWVDRHDDAYAWAERTQCAINPVTGALQIYEVEHVDEPLHPTTSANDAPSKAESTRNEAGLKTTDSAEQADKSDKTDGVDNAKSADSAKSGSSAAPEQYAAHKPARPTTPLLHLSDENFLRLGVPESALDLVKDLRTDEELAASKPRLPLEVFDALTMLALGLPYDDVLEEYAPLPAEAVDTTNLTAALERPGTQRRFRVFADDEELLRMLNAPLERWRVYLHPSQRAVVQWKVNGPIRVTGGAGTGKTVVAMHRARYLVREIFTDPADRILFTTYTRNLALDIEANLKQICTPAELKRIDVINIDAWVSAFLKRQNFEYRIVYEGGRDNTMKQVWEEAHKALPHDERPITFYKEEWQRVVLPQNITDIRAYLRADRTGRGVGLNRKQRAEIWPVFERAQTELARRNCVTFEQAVHAAIERIDHGHQSKKYQAIIVDEAQDFGTEIQKLLRKVAGEERPNDLFIVGDAHQRIYNRPAPLSNAGINVVGRSRKLRVNYRTTEEIRDFAMRVLEDIEFDDLDHQIDRSQHYKSLVSGTPPTVEGFSSSTDETDWIAKNIRELTQKDENNLQNSDICVVLRTNKEAERYANMLQEIGIPTTPVSRDGSDAKNTSNVRVATMHRVKGLGFKAVFVAGLSDESMPLQYAVTGSSDEAVLQEVEQQERSLLHVACTRAAHVLFLSWTGTQSRFLAGL